MKKLMIAAAIVCAAAFANAACAKWNIDNSYMPGTTENADSWAVYFFDANDVSSSAMTAAISGNTFASLLSQGVVAETDEDGAATKLSADKYGNGVDVTGYYVLFNDADTASATKAYVSTEITEATGSLGNAAVLDWEDDTRTQTAANWTAIGAPEPTSGLLMLLGMGALALRRRRA